MLFARAWKHACTDDDADDGDEDDNDEDAATDDDGDDEDAATNDDDDDDGDDHDDHDDGDSGGGCDGDEAPALQLLPLSHKSRNEITSTKTQNFLIQATGRPGVLPTHNACSIWLASLKLLSREKLQSGN